MKSVIAIFAAAVVMTAVALGGPSTIWQMGNWMVPEELVPQGTTVAEISKADTVYKFVAEVVTVDGRVIPMYIEGITRAGDGGRPIRVTGESRPVEGWKPTGFWGWAEEVYVFVSVEFEENV